MGFEGGFHQMVSHESLDFFILSPPARQRTIHAQGIYHSPSLSLVRHLEQNWFRLKPDLLVQASKVNRLVLDTKWKLIDSQQASGTDKYGLDQGDFYQLHAYGQNYLDGQGEVVLIYPRTEAFNKALPVFEFPKASGLRLWVLPFCLRNKRLLLPQCGSLDAFLALKSPTMEEPHKLNKQLQEAALI